MPSKFSRATLAASVLTLVCAGATAVAQEIPTPQYNSPFSRFGLGDLTPEGYATQLGMGLIGQGYSDPHIANPVNPASLASLRFATYQVGLGLSRERLRAGDVESTGLNGNLRYLSLAFTTRNTLNDLLDARTRKTRYAMLFSLTPYSTQGYNIELDEQRAGVGTVVNAFQGTGGFYRLRSGHALEIGRQLRIGAHASYLFGRTDARTSVRTTDLPGASLVADTESLRARGFDLTLGGQYDFILARRDEVTTKLLTVGATATLTGDLQGTSRRLITRENVLSGRDTLFDEPMGDQRIEMPRGFGVGVYYRVVNKFALGADLSYQTWDRFRSSLRPDERLTSGLRVGVGGEWTPDYQTFNKFHRIVRYRFGVYYEQDARPGVDADRGLTLGFGLPVIRAREEMSYVNLSLNAGSLATAGAIEQQYLRLLVGFTLTDNSWFYKRRFK